MDRERIPRAMGGELLMALLGLSVLRLRVALNAAENETRAQEADEKEGQ